MEALASWVDTDGDEGREPPARLGHRWELARVPVQAAIVGGSPTWQSILVDALEHKADLVDMRLVLLGDAGGPLSERDVSRKIPPWRRMRCSAENGDLQCAIVFWVPLTETGGQIEQLVGVLKGAERHSGVAVVVASAEGPAAAPPLVTWCEKH